MAGMTKLAVIAGLTVGAAGCLTVADDQGPLLSFELYWDERPGAGFRGGTCDDAGVVSMAWRLLDGNGEEVDSDVHDCFNAVDVVDPGPGDYTLEVEGYDEDVSRLGDSERPAPGWRIRCKGAVLRFDSGYACDVCDADHVDDCKTR